MRRMIPGKLIEKIKSLFTSLWSDDEGNVEIGKNLEVDGSLSVNGATILNADSFIITEGGIDYDNNLKNGFYGNDSTIFLNSNEEANFGINCDDEGIYYDRFDKKTKEHVYSQVLFVDNLPKLYRHHLTLTAASGTDCQDYYSHSNLVVDSIQDLTAITGGHPFGSGTGYTYVSNVWKHGSANVTAVADDVQLVTN